MRRALCGLLLLSAWITPGTVRAEAFRSYATVVDVQPIVETIHEPVSRRVCSDPDRNARDYTPPGASIAADIREQQRLWQAQRSCQTVTENRSRQKVTAYRVTYRYRGYTATTQLANHPGKRMPVNVSLSPLP